MITKYDLWIIIPALISLMQLNNSLSITTVKRQPPPPLPRLITLIDSQTKNQIVEHNLWDKARGKMQFPLVESAQVAEKPIQWQLKAVNYPHVAAIQVADKIHFYHQGETLPDGAYLQHILIDGITVKREQTVQVIYLFGKKP
ncbi:MAG: hypothetical protein RL637_420 [Pseudomonadota bacterium]|jgi:hypothetical protein